MRRPYPEIEPDESGLLDVGDGYRIPEMVLLSVVTTTRREVEWVTRHAGRFFPAHWARFRDGVPRPERDGSLVEAYNRLLLDPDPAVHEQAARDWCAWEDTHVRARPGAATDGFAHPHRDHTAS